MFDVRYSTLQKVVLIFLSHSVPQHWISEDGTWACQRQWLFDQACKQGKTSNLLALLLANQETCPYHIDDVNRRCCRTTRFPVVDMKSLGSGSTVSKMLRTLLDDDNNDDFFTLQRCQFKFLGVNHWNIPNLIKCSSVTLKPGWEVSQMRSDLLYHHTPKTKAGNNKLNFSKKQLYVQRKTFYYINCSVLQGFLPPRNVVSEHT